MSARSPWGSPVAERPVIVGMNNPVSVRPEHALYPHPPGCAGYRLWKMLHDYTGASRGVYTRGFERMNLVTGVWSTIRARERAERLRAEMTGRTVLLLGEEVRRAVGVDRLLADPQLWCGVTWRQLPHPSGRNPWYNDAANRRLAGAVLEEMLHV